MTSNSLITQLERDLHYLGEISDFFDRAVLFKLDSDKDENFRKEQASLFYLIARKALLVHERAQAEVTRLMA